MKRPAATELTVLTLVLCALSGTIANAQRVPAFGGSAALQKPNCCCEHFVKPYNGTADLDDGYEALIIDCHGDTVAVGTTQNGSGDLDILVVKYHRDGMKIWASYHAGTGGLDDTGVSLVVDECGDIYVTGSTVNTDTDAVTLKYRGTDGALLWAADHDDDDDAGVDLVLDGRGSVYVLAKVGPSSSPDYAILKYDTSTGALASGWPAIFDNGGTADHPRAITVDHRGNPVATGDSEASDFEFTTVKFDAATGSIDWVHQQAALGNDRPTAIAIDCSGDAFVTGTRAFEQANADYMTIRIDGTTGSAVWTSPSIYNGTAAGPDEALDLGLDRYGHAIVTGRSWAGQASFDYLTLKLDAATGAALWEQRYAGPERSTDEALAVAVDKHGRAHVTGRSFDSTFQTSEIVTLRYRASDGLQTAKRVHDAAVWNEGKAVAVDNHTGCVFVAGHRAGSLADALLLRYDGF